MARPEINVLSRKLIRVLFDPKAAITESLQNIDNYLIAPVTEGADPIVVREIRGVDFEEFDATSYVDVRITTPTPDATYQLTINNLVSEDNDPLIDQVAQFKAKTTKVDSMIDSTSYGLYSRDLDSVMSQVLLAMALEDERVGGQGDLAPLPEEPAPSGGSTYGNAIYGTDTYGG